MGSHKDIFTLLFVLTKLFDLLDKLSMNSFIVAFIHTY